MEKDDCILLGEILKVHGYQGELVVGLDNNTLIGYLIPESPVFLDIDGGLVPFFLKSIEERDNRSLIIGLEDIDSEKQARALQGTQIYILKDSLPVHDKSGRNVNILMGFEIFDPIRGSLGRVDEVMELPMHTLLKVNREGREHLLPLHEDLIVSIDQKKKVIVMNIPAGMEDISEV